MWRLRTGVAAATVALMLVGLVGPSAGGTTSSMVVTPTGISSVEAVSHDGRWVEANGLILDRLTGVSIPTNVAPGEEQVVGFIRDNPVLWLVVRGSPALRWYADGSVGIWDPDAGVYLMDTRTGARQRIDTDAAGTPLAPSWTGQGCQGGDACAFSTDPALRVSTESVSRDGGTAAFCANYVTPSEPLLYVKDLMTGRLTRTSVRCGVSHFQEEDDPFVETFHWPEVSDDARVIHVRGDVLEDHMYDQVGWQGDSLYFPTTGKARRVHGQGMMTRDGDTIFLRMGVQKPVRPARASKKVGAYSVRTKRTTRLPWWNRFYGDGYQFLATSLLPTEMTTRRGRYLVNESAVLDRTRGITIDIGSLLRERGYDPEWVDMAISGDGRTIFATVASPGTLPYGHEVVAVTGWGWKHMARATVSSNRSQTKLVVDVDPNKGSGYWTFTVQRRQESGIWETLPGTYRTQGSKETRTLDLPNGTYRVQVKPKYGFRGYISGDAYVTR